MSGHFRHADPDALRLLAVWLVEAGLGGIEVEGSEGTVRLRVAPGHALSATRAPPPAGADIMVRAGCTGTLLLCHPLCPKPLAEVGTKVAAKQVVALLRTGPVYAPVFAPVAGRVLRLLGEDGAMLGHGSPVLELSPERS